MHAGVNASIEIKAGAVRLPGDLDVPDGARALVIFAHGSGSGRRSPRNVLVARALSGSAVIGTLLFDLLTPAEDARRANRFDIPLLAERLVLATGFVLGLGELAGLPVGYFGASTGAASAIIAADILRNDVQAVVSRGGRPDLAGDSLGAITQPTLFIVGGADREVLVLNARALERVPAVNKRLEVVPGATHLFEEPGALEAVASLAREWFERFLVKAPLTVPRD